MSYSLSDFDYVLPSELIAQQPADPRDSARLLLSDEGGINSLDYKFSDLLNLLRAGDILVMNNTRVLPARLQGWREKVEQLPNGKAKKGKMAVEVLLHRCTGNDDEWLAFCRPAKKLKQGQEIFFEGGKATIIGRDGEQLIIKFSSFGDCFEAFLKQAGDLPLPPYISRPEGSTEDDSERYQTVYAHRQGAVAAPTAGLHFTENLLEQLKQKDISTTTVTLHVGAGTFQPVRNDDLSQHIMHSEWGEVTEEAVTAINAAKKSGGRVVCVGTTSLRLIETAARGGVLKPFSGDTDIFITPGFGFKVADGLLTNFHLPKSTLLMLVAAFTGYDKMRKIYQTAIADKYRFYSYGDSSLLWRK